MESTLLQEVEAFLYSHAQNMLNKKQLLTLVASWEAAYQKKIEELENRGNRIQKAPEAPKNESGKQGHSIMDWEGGPRYDGID